MIRFFSKDQPYYYRRGLLKFIRFEGRKFKRVKMAEYYHYER